MKLKSLCRVLILSLATLFAISCNENLDQIGFSIQPEKDRLKIKADTLDLQARTVSLDSIYSKTLYPVLGEYIDPVFGSIKSEYIGEFYFAENSKFHTGALIDSVRVQLAYTSMMGDSLSPMELSVYEVIKSLKGANPYSQIDPKEYADMSAPLGTQTFTGKNSIYRKEATSTGDSIKVYEINVKLPNALGEKFLAEYNKNDHGYLVNPDKFREFFPGLYFTTTFGKSTMLNISITSLQVHYQYLVKKGSYDQERDTTIFSALNLVITPEVTQINHFQNKNDQLLAENTEYTFVKSPAGVMTEITLPFSEKNEALKSQALNLARLNVYAMPDPQDETFVKLSPPDYLLLIHKDSLNGFFENKKLNDNVTSFLSSKFDSSTYSYNFGNISTMVNYYNEKNNKEPFDLVYYLVPVNATYVSQQNSYYGSTTQVLTGIQHRMWPSATRLDKREGNLKLDLIFSNF